MLQQHVDAGADVTVGCLEVPRMEATGFGVMHVDEKDRIIAFVEKPADPPGMPGQPGHGARLHGHLRLPAPSSCIDQLRRDAADPNSSRDFGKDIIPYIVKHGKAVAHRFAQSCVRSRAEARRLLARRRHGRRLLGGQHRPDRHRPGARPLRHAPGRSGPTPRSRRRRSSSTTTTAAAASAVSLARLRRLHRLRRRAAPHRCSSPACASTPSASLEEAVVLPDVDDRPRARGSRNVVDRPRRADPRRPGRRRGSRSSTPSASAAPRAASA